MDDVTVKGLLVDDHTRCNHYKSGLDIIAIKFKCCLQYYACIHCHEEMATHSKLLWSQAEWNTKAILCGNCKHEMSINEYLNGNYKCLKCNADFNPKCSNHNHLYFDIDE